jgi:hypothetical protein
MLSDEYDGLAFIAVPCAPTITGRLRGDRTDSDRRHRTTCGKGAPTHTDRRATGGDSAILDRNGGSLIKLWLVGATPPGQSSLGGLSRSSGHRFTARWPHGLACPPTDNNQSTQLQHTLTIPFPSQPLIGLDRCTSAGSLLTSSSAVTKAELISGCTGLCSRTAPLTFQQMAHRTSTVRDMFTCRIKM